MRISDWSSGVCSSDLPGRASSTATTSAGARSSASAAACRSGFSRELLPLLLPCEAAPAKACGFESPAAVPLDGEDALRARLALEHRHPLTRHPQARLVQHAQARQVARVGGGDDRCNRRVARSEEHTSELQSLMRISYAAFCLQQ